MQIAGTALVVLSTITTAANLKPRAQIQATTQVILLQQIATQTRVAEVVDLTAQVLLLAEDVHHVLITNNLHSSF